MTDNLRGAVAEVAMHFLSDRELAWLTQDQSLALADAVIRELGDDLLAQILEYRGVPQRITFGADPKPLKREWRATGNSCAGPQESREDALLYGATVESRYVTDWEIGD